MSHEPGVIKGPINKGGILVPEDMILITGPSSECDIYVTKKEYQELGVEGAIKKYLPKF